jgi:excisionase family DNA binding protein
MDSINREESFLTVAEVAEMLKLNQQTVRNWIDQGSLPALRVGRRVRIKRSDFERIIEQGYSGGADAAAASDRLSAEDFWGGTPVGLAEQPDGPSQPGGANQPDGPEQPRVHDAPADPMEAGVSRDGGP